MSNVLDRVFSEVCLDNRISDGIFRMENDTHMGVLRDYFVKKGITKEAAVHVTNRMIEGKYPDRQAYNKDGILCTFPTPQYKARAIAKETHFEKNPVPQVQQQQDAEEDEPKQAPPGSNPEPGELPNDDEKETDKDTDGDEDDDDFGGGGSHGGGGSKDSNIFQGDKKLSIEPPRGEKQPEPPPQPPQPNVPPPQRTPQYAAAEKEVVRGILSTDDTSLSNIGGPLNVNEAALRHQLQEIYKKADEWGFYEATKFLQPYIL